ncbi:RNA polymerase sigma factor RpoH [Wohlfahrtiimonas chitiniclastica]|uniref:RNA polymerase sigma factor RpoH n=2 Tax=Wohlfahrtiimonas chitiniclastica TaxID=400946 RepID=L8XVN4_9GAMM|nr:RNA polymerase sigma factor RpoH [Wohlfahrtiimonas chitiniclastica]ELV07957.1 RNA polymerase sigma-32 factor [Wohlfahrtiimonas chitiniclastica SH04]KZS23861.1 RNA polymerase factor sigma-32 [Wohlfahrtiimonas chitiniclastica]KZX36631.1 RNA polymerase factor sigma-32 [Wohlfahrtiimonas chitiniclastica]MBS7814512.1 RNA polymerase sigma factor RpoH [Wohlfahrtiimonas chitiniclastica]MBS7816532.1 RNA polymerase sigma factor RpoH [Wohlfahrtiimonas chitiniclastica]
MNKSLVLRANSLPAVSDDFSAYTSAIADIPTLTAEEERELATRLIEHNDIQAAQLLVIAHLKFVVHIAKGFSGYGLPLVDLVQEGNVGLMKAVKRFDPKYNVRLISFAVHWIKSEIHDFVIRNWRIVKVATTKAQRKLFFNLRSSKERLGWLNENEAATIADELNVSVDEVKRMESRLFSNDVSFDLSNSDDDNEHYSPSEWLADEEMDPSMQVEQDDTDNRRLEALTKAMASLDDRSRDIVQRRWMEVDDSKKPTLHELAAEYSVSAERIRQIEAQAMTKLKKFLVE